MDRSLSKGTAALAFLWLQQAEPGDWHSHQPAKEILSSADEFNDRAEMREQLVEMAVNDSEIAEILEIEKNARDGVTAEPIWLACHSIARALAGES